MPTNPLVLLEIHGNLGSTIMMSHRMTLLALTSTADERWADALAALGRFFNSQQVLRLLLTCEGIQGVSKHKNLTITLRNWQRR